MNVREKAKNDKRLIDANDIYSLFDKSGFARLHVADIDTIPRVDAVEVVRCRDCIGRSTWYNDAEYGCAVCGMSGMYPKSEDGFCSYGIRNDGDRNG